MKRVATGIEGFDRLVEGGLPQGSCTLLSGTPGTGKTIFALEYLYRGAEKGEKGLYFSLEQPQSSLHTQAEQFGWKLKDYVDGGLVKFVYLPPSEISDNVAKDIAKTITDEGYQRVVIDSLSALCINAPTTHTAPHELTDISIQRFIYQFVTALREAKATTLFISQARKGNLSSDGVSEFVCDGIVHIVYEPLGGNYSRMLSIRKMRHTKNDDDVHPLEISSDRVRVHTLD